MRSHRKATFSIVAADGPEVGCAVQSRYFAVGSVVPWAKAGVGAVATQAAGVAVYGPQTLAFLEGGLGPEAALEQVLAGDPARESRQLGAVAADGSSASFTGAECLAWAGHRTGDGYAVQGNILAGEAVVVEMERAFLETGGSLAERLVSALEAGQAAGGDSRGQQSAAIVVERVGAASESREGIDRVCELRVEDHPTPIAELRRLLGIHLVWDSLRRATRVPRAGPVRGGRRDPARGARGAGRGRRAALRPRVLRVARRATPRRRSRTSRASLELDAGLRAGAAGDSDFDALRSDPRFAGARPLGSPAAWTSTSTRARSSSGAPASRCRTAGSRPRPEEARAAAEELGGPVVVKAQVLTGGRGKAGGIKLAETPDEAEARAGEILGLDIRGHVVRKLWIEKASDIAKEYYLSVTFDRGAKAAALHVHDAGRRGHRGGRARPRRTRSSGCTSIRSRASSPGTRGALIYGAGVDDPDEQKQIAAIVGKPLRGVRRLRRDALRDQPADRHAGRRGEGARLEVHGRRQRALPAPRHRRDARPGGVPARGARRAREGRHLREARRRGRHPRRTAPGS